MKTAGYDIALLINERFFNQLSGALFYGGFLTANGSIDLYNGAIAIENTLKDLSIAGDWGLVGEVTPELRSFLNIDFRMKLTQEPLIDLLQGAAPDDQMIRLAIRMRIYLLLWQGFEVKFEASFDLTAPITLDNMNLVIDLGKAEVNELVIKYGNLMDDKMKLNLDKIVRDALSAYFKDKYLSIELKAPTFSDLVKELDDYLQAGNDGDVVPLTVDAVRIVSPTVLALGINVLDYHGGNPDQLHDFARNCSLAVAVTERAMNKIVDFVWRNSRFGKQSIGNDGSLWLLKDNSGLTVSKSGNVELKGLNDFFNDAADITSKVTSFLAEAASGGFINTKFDYLGMEFGYAVKATIKSPPVFDLLGGNEVKIYNMPFSIFLELFWDVTIETEIAFDSSGWIPDILTPWEDDIVISRKKQVINVFHRCMWNNNMKLKEGRGIIVWNEETQTLELKITKINLYWGLDKPGSPLYGFRPELINCITDQIEKAIVQRIRTISVTPPMSFEFPCLPWPLQATGRNLEVTNSEAIIAADFGFKQLVKGAYPVPKYIVNINNREIHKIGCDSVADTYEVHQRGYHLLSDALDHGFDGCQKCLPAFHTR